MHLFLSIYGELNIIKSNGIKLMDIDYVSILERINSYEKMDQINKEFYTLFEAIATAIDKSKDDKTERIIKTAICFIEDNYADPNLSTNSVSEKVMMSPVYLGMIFRDAPSKSIYDYISDVRLSKAEKLLRDTDYTIAEILEKIGWENQKYFYVKFKKHFGVTPSTYRINNLAHGQ